MTLGCAAIMVFVGVSVGLLYVHLMDKLTARLQAKWQKEFDDEQDAKARSLAG